MKPILFEADTLNYSNNGIGVLYDVIRLEVEEERNGYFGLEMEYPVDGEWFKELKDQRLILAKPNDVDEPHVFRIYEIDKNLEDGVVYILANTITDDLSGNLVIDGVVKDATAQMALNEIRTNLIEPTHFDFVSDIQTKSSSSWTRINPLQAIAGVRGSLVDLWGGEIKRTNKTLYLFSRRGKDKVATIRPGKNIDGFNMVVSTKGMITRILPFFEYSFQGLTEYEMVRDYDGNLVKQAKYTTNSSETEPTTVLGDVVVSDLANKYPVNYHEPIDFSSDEDITEKVEKFINDKEEELKNSPTIIDTTYFEDELKDYVKELVDDRASRYFTYDNPGVDKPNVEINVDILQLSDSPEWEKYKKLEHIQLTDTVEIYVRKFDVDVEVTISAIVYDSIGERVVSITAGSIQTSLSDSIKKEYEDTNLKMEQYYNSMVNGIQNTIMRTADGLNNKFTGYTEPPADISSEGDLWFKLVGEGQVEIYIYTGGKWDPVISEAVFDALEQDMEQAMIDVQDAKNRADEAYTNANIATQKAIESIGIAQEGFDAAQDALETATLSDGKAEQALTKAQDGFNKAQQALADASGADSKADQALSKAQEGFDKAQESFDKIDNLTIGARNLLTETSKERTGTVLSYYAIDTEYIQSLVGEEVTISFDVKKQNEGTHIIDCYLRRMVGDAVVAPVSPSHAITNEWRRISYTLKVPSGVLGTTSLGVGIRGNISVSGGSANTGNIIVKNVQLEKGNIPSSYTEAPEDTDQKISVIADDLDGLSVEVSNNKGEISTVKQTTQGLQTKVQNAEGNIADLIQTADGLQTRVQNAEGEISTVKQTAQGLQSRVETVENWEIGDRNLIENSNFFNGLSKFTTQNTTGGNSITVNNDIVTITKASSAHPNIVAVGSLANVELNTPLTALIRAKRLSGTGALRARVGAGASSPIQYVGEEYETLVFSLNHYGNNNFVFELTENGAVEIDWVKLVTGNKTSLTWSPAPEDTEQKFSQITQTVSGIQTTVSNKADKSEVTQLAGVVDTKISTVDANNKFATQSQLTQTSSSLTSEINKKVNNTTYTTKMQQLDNSIAGKISMSDAEGVFVKGTTFTATVDGLQTAVNSKASQSSVTQLAGVVDTKISTTDANNKFATQSQLTQTSNSLTSIIQKASTGGGDNLVSDGSFEYDGLGWESHSRFSIVKTDKYSGEKSLRVTAGSGTAQFKLINDIPVTPGRTYEASIWYKTSSDANGTAANQKLRVGTPSGGTTSMTLGFTGASTTWKKLTGRYTAVSSSPYLIVSIVANHTSGIVYWDDVSIRDVTDIADAQSEISTINQTVSGIATQVSKKVDQTTYNTYVQQTANTLAAKINTTTADGKYATKTALTATADGIQTEVNKKVNTTTYNSKMTQLDSAIQARITTATADGKYTAQTTFTQTVNSITGRIDSMEAISGNLVNNPVVTGNHSGWTGSGLSSVNREFEGVTDRVLQSSTSSDTQYYSSYFDVDPSKTYEVSMWISKSASGQYYVGLNGLNSSGSTVGFVAVNSSGEVSNANNTNFYFRSGNVGTSWIHVVGYIMPVGTKPSTMRNMGTATNNAIMKQNVRRIRVRFLNWSNGGTTRQLWVANPKVVEVSSGVFSQTSQLQDAINLRVQKNDVVNQLNIDTSGILLQGKKISLDGDTTVLGTFRVANANITSLTGNKITSGTINAANVNIINMNASNISTGYLNVDRLNGNISTFIQSNWNSLTSEVSITASGLKTYSDGQQTSLLNGSGHRFYRNNMFIGHIGTSNWSGDASYRGLRFGLENNADYMSWGFKNSSSDYAYTTMLAWHKTGSKSNKGFTFSDDVKIYGNLLATDYVSTNRLMTNFRTSRELRLDNSSVTVGNWSSEGVSLSRGDEGGKIHWSTDSLILYGGVGRAHILLRRDNTSPLVLSSTIYNRTYSGQSTVVITSSGTLGRLSSARKYKLSIENQFRNNEEQLEHSKKMLGLNVRSWFDKAESELLAEECKQGKVLSEDTFKIKRHVGLVAEEVESAGLSEFVIYGDDGQVEGIAYEKMWIQLIPIIKKHEETISLQQQVIDNLQLKIAQMEAKG